MKSMQRLINLMTAFLAIIGMCAVTLVVFIFIYSESNISSAKSKNISVPTSKSDSSFYTEANSLNAESYSTPLLQDNGTYNLTNLSDLEPGNIVDTSSHAQEPEIYENPVISNNNPTDATSSLQTYSETASILPPDTLDNSNTEMTIHFIDVGQGDATLILCDGEAMLIDAGDNSKGTKLQLYLQNQGIHALKYVIGTHPDSDHIGGLDVILYKFDCQTILLPNITSDTATYRDVIDTINNKGYFITYPYIGDSYTLGNAEFTILSPAQIYADDNNNSISIMLQHAGNKFLFTGDAEIDAEADMLRNNNTLAADVYKVGHHGSRSSSSIKFLNSVNPSYAVISCGSGNSYGHPSAEVLNNLRMLDCQVFRTDEQGTIIAYSNRSGISWNMSPSTSWIAGEPLISAGSSDTNLIYENPIYESEEETYTVDNGNKYATNINTGKIHMIGCCKATTDPVGSKNAIKPEHRRDFATYEEAEACSIQAKPNLEERKCKNCW